MRLLRLGYLLWLFGILIMPTLAQPWCLYPAAAFAAAGSLLAGITLTSILMTYCPGDKKVLAAFFLVLVPRQASAPASLGLGILGDLVGLKWLLIGSGFLFVLALRRIRTMQAAIDQGAGGGESQSPETDQTDDASSA